MSWYKLLVFLMIGNTSYLPSESSIIIKVNILKQSFSKKVDTVHILEIGKGALENLDVGI